MNMAEVGTTGQTVYPSVRYNDAKAAIEWLKSVLGFEEKEVCAGDDDTIVHAELKLAGNLIMLGTVKVDPCGIYIALDNDAAVDAGYTRAKGAGAEIIRELEDTDYSSHEFGVRDPEGNIWSFGTYRPQA